MRVYGLQFTVYGSRSGLRDYFSKGIREKERGSKFEVRGSKFRDADSEIFNCSVVVELVIERSRNGVMTGH